MPSAGRTNHVIALRLENRSFDHGFFKPSVVQKSDDLPGAGSGRSNLFYLFKRSHPSDTPRFLTNNPAPSAVHHKEGPSHSFNSVCMQLCDDRTGPSHSILLRKTVSRARLQRPYVAAHTQG
jgi:hypothetical protein